MVKGFLSHLKSIFATGEDAVQHRPLEILLNQFRAVLNSNNRAVEIVTDMGEKLGGDYLFDVIYVKRAYEELFDAISGSIVNFDMLTQNKYLQLHDILKHLDFRIRRALSDVSLESESYEKIISYEDITWDMYPDVGGKNASLTELKNFLRLNVPDGFVISVHAFDEFILFNSLKKRIESLHQSSVHNELLLNELRDLIINAQIPPDIDVTINASIEKLKTRCGEDCFVAVRSSAEEEDGEFSFAGQFETLLNVPLKGDAVKEAYKRVVASLFSVNSVTYQKSLGYNIGKLKMAVGCMVMVDAATSGVIYSTNPTGTETMIINSAWGLGAPIVEGQTDADYYLVKKSVNPEIIDRKYGQKEFMTVRVKGGGTENIKTPDQLRGKSSLSDNQITELALQTLLIEKHFRKPQDIEWAIDGDGRIFILQSRQMRTENSRSNSSPFPSYPVGLRQIELRNRGTVVQKGIGAGRVFILENVEDLRNLPRGAILVARHDSSNFVRLMTHVSAIITNIGTPTSHMASLSREFKVPTVVNTGNATEVLKHGQEITLTADDERNIAVYDGIVPELIERADANYMSMEDVYEYRKKRYVLRHILPLNLIDPLLDDFTVKGCRTIHDIIRFIHEKSITELIDSAENESAKLKRRFAAKLDLPILAGIVVIDIGGGLNLPESPDDGSTRNFLKHRQGKLKSVTFEEISSLPLKAIIKGMIHPDAWHSQTISLRATDFLTSMLRTSDIVSESMKTAVRNLAIASKEYLNLNLRLGYHFTILDCYCSENARDNHIYFRFVGGATDIVKRSRRVQLVAAILKEYGFSIRIKGDLLIARLANMGRDEIVEILERLGLLIAYTRRLDALLRDDSSVDQYVKNFLEGNYKR
jgi:pyruvate,water dikinase